MTELFANETYQQKGSTLITVLISVSFLMILAAIILTVSSANLRMKQIEYVAKKNFYNDEQALDDIYNGIGKTATDCLTKAYAEILAQVSTKENESVYKDQEDAFKAFSERFIYRLNQVYPEGVCDMDTLSILQSYIIDTEIYAKVEKYEKIELKRERMIPFQYIFKDLEVKYIAKDKEGNETGYETVITTDIVIEVPYINFFQDSSRILDYALIGNKGVYFKGIEDGAKRGLEGNLYAGTSENEEPSNIEIYRDEVVYGGLNIYNTSLEVNTNLLISKGDINIRNSNIFIENKYSRADVQVWAESIRTVETLDRTKRVEPSTLKINGNIYLANDLELNARNSDVSLEGTYYGYNDNTYVTQEKESAVKSSERISDKHTQSSAIIINGNQSILDLSKLTTLVVAGFAYIELESQAYTTVPLYNGGNLSNQVDEYQTGESIALKTNQYIYLAPTNCLKTTNPVKTTEALNEDEVWQKEADWFGISGGFVNTEKPVIAKVVKNRTSGDAYTYYYLNFQSGKQRAYVDFILNMIDPVNKLTDMDSSLKTKFDYESYDESDWKDIWEIKLAAQNRVLSDYVKTNVVSANDTASIYTNGAISQISDTDGLTTHLPAEINGLSTEYIAKIKSNILKHYEYLYKNLDPKEQFSLTSDSLGRCIDSGKELPVSKFVELKQLVTNGDEGKYRCNSAYKTIIRPGDYTLSDAEFQGIIIAGGNVTIQSTASVKGLIIAGGKIYVESNAGSHKIEANRSIVQQILDEEMTIESKKKAGEAPNPNYASTYLKEFTPVQTGSDQSHRITGTDYTDYISYANWRKDESD